MGCFDQEHDDDKIFAIEEAIDVLELEISDLGSDLFCMEDDVNRLENEIEDKEDEVINLKNRIENKETELDELYVDLKKAKEEEEEKEKEKSFGVKTTTYVGVSVDGDNVAIGIGCSGPGWDCHLENIIKNWNGTVQGVTSKSIPSVPVRKEHIPVLIKALQDAQAFIDKKKGV